MARIAGIDLPKNKRGEIGLTYIYGIGRSRSREILTAAGVDFNIKVQDWTDDQLQEIRNWITDNVKVEGGTPFRNSNEHQAIDGYRMPARYPSPSGTAPSWSAYQEQLAYS